MSIYRKLSIFIVIASYVLAIYLYSRFPSTIATHWNIQGAVDGYSSKSIGLFLMPTVSLAVFGLFILIPRIDPLKKNIEKFMDSYDLFIFSMTLIFTYIYALTIAWNLGSRFSFNIFISPALALLFYITGDLLAKAKRNWFIGIRTPWTMQNDQVWDQTHQLGSKLFKISALFSFIGIIFPRYTFLLIIIPVTVTAIAPIAYSYFLYQRKERG